MRSPVAVEDAALGQLAAAGGHDQGIDDQVGAHVLGHRVARHLAGGQIDHGGQVQPALPGRQVGDVPDQRWPGAGRGEVPAEQVRRAAPPGPARVSAGGAGGSPRMPRWRMIRSTRLRLTRRPARAVGDDPRRARRCRPNRGGSRRSRPPARPRPRLAPRRLERRCQPGVEPRPGHPQHPAQPLDAVGAPVGGDEPEAVVTEPSPSRNRRPPCAGSPSPAAARRPRAAAGQLRTLVARQPFPPTWTDRWRCRPFDPAP